MDGQGSKASEVGNHGIYLAMLSASLLRRNSSVRALWQGYYASSLLFPGSWSVLMTDGSLGIRRCAAAKDRSEYGLTWAGLEVQECLQ